MNNVKVKIARKYNDGDGKVRNLTMNVENAVQLLEGGIKERWSKNTIRGQRTHIIHCRKIGLNWEDSIFIMGAI